MSDIGMTHITIRVLHLIRSHLRIPLLLLTLNGIKLCFTQFVKQWFSVVNFRIIHRLSRKRTERSTYKRMDFAI